MIKDINFDDFSKIDIRVGSIVDAYLNKLSKKPAIILIIDFGSLGIFKSSAQITKNYTPENLLGFQVIAIVNFPKKQIANFMSECLILGVVKDKGVVLLRPDSQVNNGLKIY